ncbi:aureusidin synthase-like [Papaver somniferum]|uniref:aureusidin synthase-like n=1 Tax=Papaver somniferum TaxID=3469 RepID=UPI000E6F7B85|nr:aureusidin synthase-like [Papaver somniferum]
MKSMILGVIDESWFHGNSHVVVNTEDKKRSHVVLSPNLTTCHPSFSDDNKPVYCCPPKHESEEPIIDFQFPDPSTQPIRVRRPAHVMDKDKDFVAKYNKAIAIMKSLPYDDPRSFRRQADIHCIFCTGAYNQQHSNSLMKIHRSWMFFPWHRMMIYFHERILGSLIGDDTFALPFWNWDSPEGMHVPDMFLNGSFVDTERDSSHLPPQVVDVNFDEQERGLGHEEQKAYNVGFMYTQMISAAKKPELFMGFPYKAGGDGYCNAPGTVEDAPHNTLHYWTGSNLNPERENMGAFYSAARDPIFYSHHSNIDRLWEVWRELRSSNNVPEDSDWLDTHFFFHNEKSQLVRVKTRDVLDVTKLRYTFDWVENPWINARPKPSVPPHMARQMLRMRNSNNHSGGLLLTTSDFGSMGRILDTIIRVQVQRPRTHRTKIEIEYEEEILVVYGIDVKNDVYAKFDVYINAVDENIISPTTSEFAGTFVNMRRGVNVVMNKDDIAVDKKSHIKLGISELLEDLEADEDDSIWVSLVPKGNTGMSISIDGIRIEYLR